MTGNPVADTAARCYANRTICTPLSVVRWLTTPGSADRVERREPGKTFAVCATWALGSSELGELRAESAVKLITDSNLCLRAPARTPAGLARHRSARTVRMKALRIGVRS